MATIPQRNDPCPCGSGKKFKKCCRGKRSWKKIPAPLVLGYPRVRSDLAEAAAAASRKGW